MGGNYECDVNGKNNTTITGKENTLKQHFNRYYNKIVNTLKGTFIQSIIRFPTTIKSKKNSK